MMVVFICLKEQDSGHRLIHSSPRGEHGMVGEGRMAIPCSHAPPRLEHQKLQTEIPLLGVHTAPPPPSLTWGHLFGGDPCSATP